MKLFMLFFMLSLPAMAALGFDLYLIYGKEMDFSKPLELTSVGWLWVKYAQDNYNLMRQTIEPGTWNSLIGPVLTQKTVVVALLPVYIAIPVVLVMKIFGLGGFQGHGLISAGVAAKGGKKKQGFSYQTELDGPKKRMKYKRR